MCVLLGSKVMDKISMFNDRPSAIHVACTYYGHWPTVKMQCVLYMYVQQHTDLNITCVQTAATLHIIICIQL